MNEEFKVDLLDLEKFNLIEPGEIISHGIVKNQQDELYMTDYRIGDNLLWVAKKGHNNDWSIYCNWASENNINSVITNGQKVTVKHNIVMLTNCTEEVLQKYRY